MTESSITINVDPANPGQFFACCGLLELADRLWPGAEGWFTEDGREFQIAFMGQQQGSLLELLTKAQQLQIENDEQSNSDGEDEDEDDEVDEKQVAPLILSEPCRLRLDWFADVNLKPWAGSMKANSILTAMANSIDPTWNNPLFESVITRDPPKQRTNRKGEITWTLGKPREPFYFDSRRGDNVMERDVGFTLDSLKKAYKTCTYSYPVVELFALIGLQRARPLPTRKRRVFEYFTWTWRLSPSVLPLAVVDEIGDPKSKGFRFCNQYRTGQKKHKAFRSAIPLPKEGD